MKWFLISLLLLNINSISQTWIEQTQPPPVRPLNSVSAVNRNVVWATGDNAVIIYTSNSGVNWVLRTSGFIGSNTVDCIKGLDSLTALCAVNSVATAVIIRTSDAGLNWQPVYIQQNGFINDIEMVSPLVGFAYGNPAGGRWSLLKTTNAGLSFDSAGMYLLPAGSETGWPNAMAASGTNIWFGTNNLRIYRSTNGGANWSFHVIASQNIYGIAFNGQTGYAVGDLFYTTTDGGGTWTQVTGLPGSGIFKTIANTAQYFWYGRGTQIFYSSNNGANFSFQYTSPVAGVYQQLCFVLSANDNILTTIRGWGVTNNGAISYYTDTEVGVEPANNKIPSSFILYQNYPNPFNPETVISYELRITSYVKLVVFDINGKVITKLIDGVQLPGKFSVNFNVLNLPSGVYFYELTSGEFTDVKKMILVK